MASANFDILHVAHSKAIGDPVAAATSDGKRWTSAQRSNHLNEAMRRLLNKHATLAQIKEERDIDASKHYHLLGAYVVSSSNALSNNTVSLASFNSNDIGWILNAYNTTDTFPIKKLPQKLWSWSQADGNSYLTASETNQFYILDGGNFRLIDGSTTTGDTITLRFILKHRAMTANDSTADTLWPSTSYGYVLDLAYKVAMEELATTEGMAKGTIKEAQVDKEIS